MKLVPQSTSVLCHLFRITVYFFNGEGKHWRPFQLGSYISLSGWSNSSDSIWMSQERKEGKSRKNIKRIVKQRIAFSFQDFTCMSSRGRLFPICSKQYLPQQIGLRQKQLTLINLVIYKRCIKKRAIMQIKMQIKWSIMQIKMQINLPKMGEISSLGYFYFLSKTFWIKYVVCDSLLQNCLKMILWWVAYKLSGKRNWSILLTTS